MALFSCYEPAVVVWIRIASQSCRWSRKALQNTLVTGIVIAYGTPNRCSMLQWNCSLYAYDEIPETIHAKCVLKPWHNDRDHL